MSSIMKKYSEESEKLFKEWKNKEPFQQIDHRSNVFIKDGVVCPEKWFSNDVRPLFLLKEAYGGDSDWDLTDYLTSDNKMGKMWKRVAHWSHGLLTTTKAHFEPYSEYHAGTFADNDDLKNIAVVNVKKSKGAKKSDWNALNEYADYDKNELWNQLEICDPTIIVCGYTGTQLDIIVQAAGQNIRKEYNNGLYYHCTINGHDVLVIDYWHPANQYPDLMNYYGILSVYQAALNNK